MIATFKETWTSIRNLNYGQEIVKKTIGQAVWYWFKYVLLVSLVLLGLSLAYLTYFTPQIPALLEKSVPDIRVDIKDSKLSTTATQPLIFGDENFIFIVNTKGRESDLDNVESGVLVLEDKLIAKDTSQTRTIDFSEMDDVSIDKPTAVNWFKDNRLTLLGIGVVVSIIIGLVLLGTYFVWKLIIFAIGGLVLFIGGKLLHKQLEYIDCLKLVAYAAVPAFLTSVIHPIFSLGVWIFFASMWMYKLPVAKEK